MPTGETGLFPEKAQLLTEISGLQTLLKKREERERQLESEVEWLKEKFLSLRRQKFGPRTERWEGQEQSVLVFNEAEAEARGAAATPDPDSEENDGEAKEVVSVQGFQRKRGKRKPLPEHLLRRVVVVELPEAERQASDGTPLRVVGKEISEKLVYEPARLEVVQYHRLRYGVDAGQPEKTAPPVPAIIPKGIATPSLLAGIITNKYADGLPLYRQSEMFGRVGVELSRASMARWIVQTAEASLPLWNVLLERLLASSYVSCDETHTQVLKEKGRSAQSQSWMWVRATPAEQSKIVLFDYDPHRSGEVARRLLAECRGFVQADGYSAYEWLGKSEGANASARLIGCNMHGRRGFEEAFKCGAKAGRGLAEQGLGYYKKLYAIEDEAKGKGMSWPERHELRQARAAPLWDEMKAWASEHLEQVPPKSKIGEALRYFLNQYERLRGYLQDGRLEADNGFAERAIRKFGIGRNNWLFSDSEAGAQASALFYSFVITAKLNEVNPYEALTRIFERLPLAQTLEDYERLADLLLSPGSSQ